MKKLNRFAMTFAALVAVFAAFGLSACSNPGAPSYSVDNPEYVTELSEFEQRYNDILERFMDGRENRTTYSDYELAAAEYLKEELVSYGYADANAKAEPTEPTEPGESGGGDDGGDANENEPSTEIAQARATENEKAVVETVDFDVRLTDSKTVSSRNVIAVYRAANHTDSTKNVIIATDYDNRYSAPYDGIAGTHSPGALYNGTSVAAELYVADYLMREKPELDFDVTFAFFGGTTTNSEGYPHGSYKYLTSLLKAEKHNNTVLFVELRRIGVDYVYAFSDARETKREAFFDGIARENALNVYKATQKSPALPLTTLDGVPYSQWVQGGHSVAFFNGGIPTLDITGGNYETLNMTDSESSEHDNICGTEDDTLANLKKLHPDYSEKAATAVTLIIKGFSDPNFIAAVEYDRDHFPDTSVLTMDWIWYLVVLAFVVVCFGIMWLVRVQMSKKYPVVAVKPKNVKMAVFGMDYEDKNSDSIYIDIKPSGEENDEIFPGVPNNKPTPVSYAAPVFDDIVRDVMNGAENGETESDGENRKDPAELFEQIDARHEPDGSDTDGEDIADNAGDGESTEDFSGEENIEKTESVKESEASDGKPNITKEDGASVKHAASRKKSMGGQAGKSSAARKSSSAPKSSSAKKSVPDKSEDDTSSYGDD